MSTSYTFSSASPKNQIISLFAFSSPYINQYNNTGEFQKEEV
jgi:hypothetical protein